ncbi:MAG: hypothetical protein K9G39_10785 [Chlorobium sp.]|uniref:hypothetical protein n=1 Tax=Chlorobium sp. TaxID=1095 RepID=UPI0025C1FCA8|nr:hypothetical protein [Chlorobium sp.]MCF8384053.1 hypothetical protein [Chlorobium sp.]
MKKTFLTKLAATAALVIGSCLPAAVSASAALQPASTLAEAEQVARHSYHFIIYKNSPYGESIPEEQRLERLNRINLEVERIQKEYALNLPKVGRLHMIARSRGIYNPEKDELVFSTNNLEHTIRHEFGHVIDIKLGVNNQEWKNLVRSLISKYDFAPSNYARNNDAEYWAEAFAYFTSPKYGKTVGRFPAELENHLVKVLATIKSGSTANLAYNAR